MNEKFDRLDALILLAGDVLIEEELDYARGVLNPDIEVSQRTDRRILRYIRHAQKKPGYHPVLDVMKRVAVVVLVIGTVLFASAMSIEAVREKFWNAIVEWYEDYIAVMFVDDEERDTMADVEFEVREPSYLPEGVVKGEQIVRKNSSRITYYYGTEKTIWLEQYHHPNNNVKIDNKNYTFSSVSIDKYSGFIIEYLNDSQRYTVVWEDEKYYYTLISRFDVPDIDTLLMMIFSIYDKK